MSDSRNERPDSFEYRVTVPRDLAESIAEHYDGDGGVRSVPDALRQAARDVLGDG